MRTLRIELTAMHAKRWANLHIPIGVILGILFTVWFVRQEQPGSMETPLVLVLGTPLVATTVWFSAWFQAVLVNAFIGLMRGGPVIHVQEIEIEAHEINALG